MSRLDTNIFYCANPRSNELLLDATFRLVGQFFNQFDYYYCGYFWRYIFCIGYKLMRCRSCTNYIRFNNCN